MQFRRLTPSIGVEITGLDLSRPLPDADFAAVREAWLAHKVAVFPGQELTEAQLMAFGERFGDLEVHVRSDYHSRDNKEIMIVSNLKENGRSIGVLGDGEAVWHIDQSYMPQPTFGTILFGDKIPAEGGDTWFADLATAYERLPAPLKDRIAGRRIVNSVDRYNRRDVGKRPDLAMNAEQLKRAPDSAHPAVRTHPLLGTKAIFYSPTHAAEFEGETRDESLPLLEELLGHMTQPDLIYRHKWTRGDVVMWDNSSTMHRRDPFPSHMVRLLKRVSFRYPEGMRVPA